MKRPNFKNIFSLHNVFAALLTTSMVALVAGCHRKPNAALLVYCGVDQPISQPVFDEFEKETGIHVQPVYDVESSRSVTLAAKLEAERDNPRADVWWGSEWFLTQRMADAGTLAPYDSPEASDIPARFKDPKSLFTNCGIRMRVLAISVNIPPPFKVTRLEDLIDPRLKGKICMARPTSGATVAHVAALYALWGQKKADTFFRALHANDVALLGGNAEVAAAVGRGQYSVGLTDCDDVEHAISDDGLKESLVIPDQAEGEMGTLAMPTTVALVKGAPHPELAKKLIDFLVKKQTEKLLIDENFAKYSVRSDPADKKHSSDAIRLMKVDYAKAVAIYPLAQRNSTALLDGRTP